MILNGIELLTIALIFSSWIHNYNQQHLICSNHKFFIIIYWGSALKRTFSIISDKCTACRSCEIACSFHFNKTFNPESSKIKIHFAPSTGNMEILIQKGCDKCIEEKVPLCIKYCAPGAIILKKTSWKIDSARQLDNYFWNNILTGNF